ncbi:hypothetical protein DFJ58DRAFT_849452 [Suillus subalutaceus]|uniref:uncharacterized protein n=1 Tax=Suillus subalutaceus TaxID=48586 RepID=UPI001B874EE4|nr:uncharacterized protein DFJ58DRAFT_849452 [Suillus subalutaceus]KAG1826500.1 hypothetical protein DFJ58DRAFT_849452 [Suillus subalutaceus]
MLCYVISPTEDSTKYKQCRGQKGIGLVAIGKMAERQLAEWQKSAKWISTAKPSNTSSNSASIESQSGMARRSFKTCLLLANVFVILHDFEPTLKILFYLEGKKKMVDADDNPTSKDKGDVHGAIAKLLFANHIKYGAAYHQNQKKFRNSVSNQISVLRTKYKRHNVGNFPACLRIQFKTF